MVWTRSPTLALPLRTALAPVRLAALALALLAYGLFSAPAPPGIGTAELAIALAGLAAVGISRPLSLLAGRTLAAPDRFEALGAAAFHLLLWPPLVVGMLAGAAMVDIVRDVLPLGFLFLPLLLHRSVLALPAHAVDLLAHALALAGVGFAMRWWIDSGGTIQGLGRAVHGDGDLYLLNSAAVSFAAVWLVLVGVPLLRRGVPGAMLGLAALAGSAVCLAALVAAVHRGAVALTGAALVVAGLYWAALRPSRLLAVGALALAAVLAWGASMDGALGLLLAKTDAVGLNLRGPEFLAVMRQVTASPRSFLLGEGWGALLANPAVGGLQVSFTHSALGYALLKGGVVGVAGLLLYMAVFLPILRRAVRVRPDIVLACAPPLLSGLLLHTSYKYLCFGICLCMLLMGAGMAGRRTS